MKKLISFIEAKNIDHTTQQHYHISGTILMERAGLLCAQLLRTELEKCKISLSRVLVCCGSGNNGGDGMVVARELYNWGYEVHVLLVSSPRTEEAKRQLKIIETLPIIIIDTETPYMEEITSLNSDDWIVDALTGIGLRDPYRNKDIIHAINSSSAQVYSIDVPSGLLEYDDFIEYAEVPCVKATITACIEFGKTSMYSIEQRKNCGRIEIISDVFPLEVRKKVICNAYHTDISDISWLMPPVEQDLYKHTRGVVAVAGGSPRSPGALVLAVQAACRTPAGLVYAMVDDAIKPYVLGQIVQSVSGAELDDINTLHAIVVGSGWGKRSIDELRSYYKEGVPLVVDADALHLIAAHRDIFLEEILDVSCPCIFTPHIGELRVLAKSIDLDTEEINWWTMAQQVADYYNVIVCAKHAINYICMPHAQPIIIEGNNPVLAIGGSGDVLAGLMGGILSFLEASCQEKQKHSVQYRIINTNIQKVFKNYIDKNCPRSMILLLYATVLAVLTHIEAGNRAKEDGKSVDVFKVIDRIPPLI